MIAVVQRVSSAKVGTVGKKPVSIGKGYAVLIGISDKDTSEDAIKLGKKLTKFRLMSDKAGKMNLDLKSTGGELLLISQFTLIADLGSGNRPSFAHAAAATKARALFDELLDVCRQELEAVKSGFFGEYMSVKLDNDGPVTLVVDTQDL